MPGHIAMLTSLISSAGSVSHSSGTEYDNAGKCYRSSRFFEYEHIFHDNSPYLSSEIADLKCYSGY
jgi:hypothetical protein